jgi:hypothetical protein
MALCRRRTGPPSAPWRITVQHIPPGDTCRDILFPLLISGRNPADCGHSRQIVRTMRTGLRAHFGPFFVSRGPLSPKQPNHGRFGTDVEVQIIQRVVGRATRCGFDGRPLRRGRPGSNHRFSVSASGRTADLPWGGFDRLVVTRTRHHSASPLPSHSLGAIPS